jgi:hypothetical protein
MAAHADGVQTILVVGGVVVGARGRCATLVLGGSRGVVECIRDVGGACMWWMSHEGGRSGGTFFFKSQAKRLSCAGQQREKKGKRRNCFIKLFLSAKLEQNKIACGTEERKNEKTANVLNCSVQCSLSPSEALFGLKVFFLFLTVCFSYKNKLIAIKFPLKLLGSKGRLDLLACCCIL